MEGEPAAPCESWLWHWAKDSAESSVLCHIARILSSKLPLAAKQLNTCLYPIDFVALKHILSSLAELGWT